ncbi:MAG: hypothetical protein AAF547_02265 [Actinomycetota bacterium]
MDRTTEGTLPPTLGPRAVERPTDAGTTLVAGLDGRAPARVDGGGLVTPFGSGWSIDWWVGADDRWHFAAREPSVRQRRVGYGPIIETSVRVPSGDVVQTVYPVQVGGNPVTVIEVRNDSPVPVALAIAVRPYGPDGPTAAAAAEPGAGRTIELDDTTVRVDGRPALCLPRTPNQVGADAEVDLVTAVEAGDELRWDTPVAGPDANAICLYPLPHHTTLRFALPAPSTVETVDPAALPDPDASSRGWTAVVEKASRFDFPDPGTTAAAGAARARLVLAAPDLPIDVVQAAPGAGACLAGLAAGGHRVECRWSLEALAQDFPTTLGGSSVDGAEIVVGAAMAAALTDDEALTARTIEAAIQLTHLVEQTGDHRAVTVARRGLAQLVAAAGQYETAIALLADNPGLAPDQADTIAFGDPVTLEQVEALADGLAPAGRFGPDDDPVAAARYWLAARSLLVRRVPPTEVGGAGDGPRWRRWRRERPGSGSAEDHPLRIDLLPVFPTAWRGGAVEVHDAAVGGGRVSFAIRWHGFRPALLWDVQPPDGRSVRLRCPGLDPTWKTGDAKGETLLTGAAEELPAAPAPGDSFS